MQDGLVSSESSVGADPPDDEPLDEHERPTIPNARLRAVPIALWDPCVTEEERVSSRPTFDETSLSFFAEPHALSDPVSQAAQEDEEAMARALRRNLNHWVVTVVLAAITLCIAAVLRSGGGVALR